MSQYVVSAFRRTSLCAAAVFFSLTLFAQEPPRFTSSVDVTPVDVTVVDDSGRPVSDLQPGDFVVRVDGKARRVVSAEWIPLTARAGPAPAPIPEGYSSNENATG